MMADISSYMNNHVSIINNNKESYLLFERKITKKIKKRKTKNGTITEYPFYQSTFPQALVDFLEIKNNTLYFYEHKGSIYVCANVPEEEHSKIKLQKYNQFSIPKKPFPAVAECDTLKLKLLLNRSTKYIGNGLLVCSIE